MSKKLIAVLSLIIMLSMVLSSCSTPTSTPAVEEPEVSDAASAVDGEIKIGMLSAFTGVFSSFGKMQKEGAELALKEVNFQAGGKKITMIYEDDQLDNEMAVTKAKKLVEQDKINILTGLVSGDEGLTVGDYMKDKNIPVVVMYSASEDMTMREFHPMIVRPTWTGAQSMDVFGYWLATEKGYKKIYAIGEDYSYPWNQGGGFKRGFCRGGGEEVKTVWFPPGTTSDFSSMIAAIPLDQGYDAVLYNGAGGDAVNFIKQWAELGMTDKIPLLGQSNTFEKPDLDSMPSAIVGSLSPHHTADNLNTPNWNTFRDKFVEAYGYPPSAASEFAYMSMRMMIRAIEALDGDVSDPNKLVEAMLAVDLSDTPRGPVTLDPELHAAVQNVYIREVAMGDDNVMFNKGLFTVKNVSQFGPYDTELYMAQPIDDNQYPPDLCSEFPAEMLEAGNTYEFVPFGQD